MNLQQNVKKGILKRKFETLNEICIQQGKELRGLILLLLACNEMLGRAKSGPYTEEDLKELETLEKHMKTVFDLFIEPPAKNLSPNDNLFNEVQDPIVEDKEDKEAITNEQQA